jgi:hypothetical protein
MIFISYSEYNIISISQSQYFFTKEDECHIMGAYLVRQSNWQDVKSESPNIQRFSKPE